MKNYYKLLGLESDAGLSDIKTAYRKLSKKFHPDTNPDDGNDFKDMYSDIQEAYKVLSNPITKKELSKWKDYCDTTMSLNDCWKDGPPEWRMLEKKIRLQKINVIREFQKNGSVFYLQNPHKS